MIFKKDFEEKKRIIFFGFTSDIWIYLLQELKKRDIQFEKNNALVIHGGGWKRLENKNISKKHFSNSVKKIF